MTRRLLTHCPACHVNLDAARSELDGRTKAYRTRLRLYDTHAPSADDPMAGADSAEGYPADHPGVDTVRGTPTALTEASALAHAYHTCGLHGLDHETLERKGRNLRTDMTRNGGWAVVRLPYDTAESFTEGRQPPRYLLRLDIRREGSDTGNGDSNAQD